jgi:hypothetical protein
MSPTALYYTDAGEQFDCTFPGCSRRTKSMCGMCHHHWWTIPESIRDLIARAFDLHRSHLEADQIECEQLWEEIQAEIKAFILSQQR